MVALPHLNGAMTMVKARKPNGNAKSKLDQDDIRALGDHELDQVSGGREPTVFKPPFPPVGR
jgi:hypothetical protein